MPLIPGTVSAVVPSDFPSASRYTSNKTPKPGAGGAGDTGGGGVVTGGRVAVIVTGGAVTTVVGMTRLPVIVGTAYGGSNRPNLPQALHGYAQERTWLGAASMGSQRESTMVAMAVGSAVCGQSVPRSARVSWRVTLPVAVACGCGPGAMVETSYRLSGSIHAEVDGPARSPRVLMPTAVGMYIYTDGEVKVYFREGCT